MCESTSPNESPTLALPSDLTIPFFSYGFLKPTELAFAQIESSVESHQEDEVKGAIFLRDGLPLLNPDAVGTVRGSCIRFHSPNEAYSAICSFEPRKHYEWSTVKTTAGHRANVLLGVRPSIGSERLDTNWESSDDPVFKHALTSVQQIVAEHGARFEVVSL